MLVTTIIHAGGMAVGLRWLIANYTNGWGMRSLLARSLVVGALVLIMFATTLLEAGVWAATYFVLGVIAEFEKALYFSTVTYTTLGYGDVVLEEHWRLLSSFEAANGIIMFGWTTALIILAIRHVSKTLKKLNAMD
jgi:voltage-gated potassium channel Kch